MQVKLWTTQNDLPEKVRGAALGLLNAQLADALGDAATADLFTGVARGVDKLLWKAEVHNEGNE